jgi:hypothetical protein
MSASRPPNAKATVYVVGAYLANGGAYMAYHLARILHLDFGYDVCVLTLAEEAAAGGRFNYDIVFPDAPVSRITDVVRDDDILGPVVI